MKDEFKAYCDQVNKVRKTKEGSPDFIEPDDFAPQVRRNSVSAEIGKKKTIDTEAAMDAEAETECLRGAKTPGALCCNQLLTVNYCPLTGTLFGGNISNNKFYSDEFAI